jgi:hypothetical protein
MSFENITLSEEVKCKMPDTYTIQIPRVSPQQQKWAGGCQGGRRDGKEVPSEVTNMS